VDVTAVLMARCIGFDFWLAAVPRCYACASCTTILLTC
jgi:hypothetical protein